MEALGIEMGIPADEYIGKLVKRDSAWNFKVNEVFYSENDSCYLQSLIRTPESIDSCDITLCLIIHSTPKTKTVFYIEEITIFEYNGSLINNSHIPIIFYYSSVYAQSMLFEAFPNYQEMTTRYANQDGEILVKDPDTKKFRKSKENYDLEGNQYQAMWKWRYGECFIRLEDVEGPVISSRYIDYKGVSLFDMEK